MVRFLSSKGNIDSFSGEEVIKQGAKELYIAKYMGGFVDQK